MITRSNLFASLIGLVAGIAAGVLTLLPRESGDAAASDSLRHRFQTSARLQDASVHLVFPGDDARLARVFSALQQPVELLRRFEVVEALKAFTAQELPSLMTRVEALPKETQKELLRPLLEHWFDTDLPAARAWALASSMDWTTMMAWAQVDPEGALKAAAESTQPWATNLADYALKGFSGRDLAAQMAHAQSLPQGWLRDRVIVQVLVQRALQDPAGAYASLGQVTDRNLRQQTRYDLLQGWAVKEPAGALEALSEMIANSKNGALGNAYVTNTAERIAIENPRLVIDWLDAIPPEQRSPLAIAAARQWARKEPIPALEWCLANGVEISRPRYREPARQSTILAEAMERAPTETLALLSALPAGTERDRLLECAFVVSLQQPLADDQSSARWSIYQRLPEESQIANAMAYGQARARQGNLQDVGAWVQNFPSSEAQANAVAGAIGAAYERDAGHANTLLTTLTTDFHRDAALRGLATAMRRTSPSGAATRALEIKDTAVQHEVLDSIVVPWLKAEPEESRKWLDATSTIPAAWKQQWLQRP